MSTTPQDPLSDMPVAEDEVFETEVAEELLEAEEGEEEYDEEGEEEDDGELQRKFLFFQAAPAWLVSTLRRLPVDRFKLSRSFLKDVPFDRSNSVIAGAIVALGEKLDIEVTASGIETEEQKRFARDIGCGIGQGFLISEALPPESFARMLGEPEN